MGVQAMAGGLLLAVLATGVQHEHVAADGGAGEQLPFIPADEDQTHKYIAGDADRGDDRILGEEPKTGKPKLVVGNQTTNQAMQVKEKEEGVPQGKIFIGPHADVRKRIY